MIDTTTYLLTQRNAAGPIIRPAEPMPHEIFAPNDDDDDTPLTRGKVIGGIISIAILAAVGAYLFLAI